MPRLAVLLLLTSPLCAQAWCFSEAAREYSLPPDLLRAIAHVESRSRADALHVNRNRSEDVGAMQINSVHFPLLKTVGIDRTMLLTDPCLNVRTGAWVLATGVKKHGYTWRAVASYNPGDPGYIDRVWDAYRNRAWLGQAKTPKRPAS